MLKQKKKRALLNFGQKIKIVGEATSNSEKKREDTASFKAVTALLP